nr:adipogenin isoform X2 [Taeniopygia guttata]
MRYPLVPLVNELTFPLLFFWFCLPFVMLLIIAIIWLQLLLNEAQMPSTEKIEKESPDEPDPDSEDELSEEENQRDTSRTEMQEESQSSGAVGRLRPKPAYLSSNPKSQSRLAVTSNSCSQRQKIRYSHAEKSIFSNILMTFSILRTLLLPSYLVTYVAQLFALLEDLNYKAIQRARCRWWESLFCCPCAVPVSPEPYTGTLCSTSPQK